MRLPRRRDSRAGPAGGGVDRRSRGLDPSGRRIARLGHAAATWTLIAFAVLEMAADKNPLVDHAMHFLHVAAKPAAAAIVIGGTTHPHGNEELIALMVVGALNALGTHGAVVAARAASTVGTAGFANPVLSTLEDAGSVGGVVLAFVAPFVAAVTGADRRHPARNLREARVQANPQSVRGDGSLGRWLALGHRDRHRAHAKRTSERTLLTSLAWVELVGGLLRVTSNTGVAMPIRETGRVG